MNDRQLHTDTVVAPPSRENETAPGAIESAKGIWRDFRMEHAAFLVTCLYLIFEYNRPQSIWPALDIIPWGKTLLFGGIFLSFTDRAAGRPRASLGFPIVAFSCCVLVSMIYAFMPSVAFQEWVIYFGWVFVIILITRVVSTRKRLFLFIVVYFLANLKMAQHGFISWATRGFGFASWGVTGSPGWFQNSGEFSMEMVVFLPLILAYIAVFRKDWSTSVRVFFYALLVMVFGSVIAANSRGGIVGLAAVALWCLAYSRQRIKVFILLALFAFVLYKTMPQEFKERFETAGTDKTSLARLAYWECGKDSIRENPYFGVGFCNWTEWVAAKHPELKGARGFGNEVEVIHNTYMQAATELGLIGTAAYLTILLKIFVTNRRSIRDARAWKDPFLEATAAGLNGSLFAYMVPSYFMSVLYYPYVWVLFALTMCVSSVARPAAEP